jgi:hypothetical protein
MSASEALDGRRENLALWTAALAWAAGFIHAAAAVEHFEEWWLWGVLFTVTTVFQFVWGAAAFRTRSERLLAAGAVINAGVVLVWVVSRTAGLPIGPEAGEPEAVGVGDVLATLDEVAIVALVWALVAGPHALERAARARALTAPVVYALAVASVVASLSLGHAH